jgi:hypothetical protein
MPATMPFTSRDEQLHRMADTDIFAKAGAEAQLVLV